MIRVDFKRIKYYLILIVWETFEFLPNKEDVNFLLIKLFVPAIKWPIVTMSKFTFTSIAITYSNLRTFDIFFN